MEVKGILCLLICIVLCGCSTQQSESLQIQGQVLMCGEGMEGVCVQLQHPQYGVVDTYTDALGVYRFEQAWISEYTITPFVENCEIVPVKRKVDIYNDTVVNDFIVRPLWERWHGSGYQDVVKDMAKTLRCGYVYAGSTNSQGSYGAFVMRVNALGQQQWYKTYWQHLYMSANGIVTLDDGSAVIVGCKAGSTTAGDIWIAKVDGNGDIMWQKTYGGSQWDEAFNVVRVDTGSDKGFLIAATTESAGNGRADIYALKCDDNGNIVGSLFDALFGGEYNDGVHAIIGTRDGGFIMAGFIEYESQVRADSRIIKINSLRQHVWSKEYDIDTYDIATDVKELENGDIIVCGISYAIKANERIWISRLTGDGTGEQWRKEFSIGKSCGIYSMAFDAKGNIICTGYTMRNESDDKDLLLLGLTRDGETEWVQVYGTDNHKDDIGRKVVLAQDDGLSICGNVIIGEAGTDIYCLKLNDKGLLIP